MKQTKFDRFFELLALGYSEKEVIKVLDEEYDEEKDD